MRGAEARTAGELTNSRGRAKNQITPMMSGMDGSWMGDFRKARLRNLLANVEFTHWPKSILFISQLTANYIKI